MSLLPLPLSSSGNSATGKTSRWPALVATTIRSCAGLPTGTGCRTRALGVNDSIALPALLRLVRFSNRVTKP